MPTPSSAVAAKQDIPVSVALLAAVAVAVAFSLLNAPATFSELLDVLETYLETRTEFVGFQLSALSINILSLTARSCF